MKNFKKVIVSILAAVILVTVVVCFSGCGNENKENVQVETTEVTITEVVTTVVSTTAPTTIAPTTIKPTKQSTTVKATEVSNDETQKDNEDEDEDGSYNDSNNSSNNSDMDSNSYSVDSNMNSEAIYSSSEFQTTGVIDWGGYEWTYYSELILPGEGLDIPGRHTTEDGYVCDGDGYVVLAADLDMLPRYSVVETPFGYTGKVYDTGCAYGTLDVYVGW